MLKMFMVLEKMQYIFEKNRTPSSAAEFSCTTGRKILQINLATLKSIVSFHRGYSTEHVKAADSILLYRTCDSCHG
jgi:hypothetical protein